MVNGTLADNYFILKLSFVVKLLRSSAFVDMDNWLILTAFVFEFWGHQSEAGVK